MSRCSHLGGILVVAGALLGWCHTKPGCAHNPASMVVADGGRHGTKPSQGQAWLWVTPRSSKLCLNHVLRSERQLGVPHGNWDIPG